MHKLKSILDTLLDQLVRAIQIEAQRKFTETLTHSRISSVLIRI